MGQFLYGISFYKNKYSIAPKNNYSSYYNLLSSILFYYVLKLSPSSFVLVLFVEYCNENFVRQ